MAFSRRHFIAGLGAVAAASALPLKTVANALEAPLYPPLDLSYFDRPITPAPGSIRFGYAAITWNNNDAQAIKEISELGFPGIQLRSNILKDYGERPTALRDLLDQYHLEMVALSSGGVGIAPGTETDEITKHVRNAKFVHDVGGHYLQVTDSARPKGRKPEPADFNNWARLTEIASVPSIRCAGRLSQYMGSPRLMKLIGSRPDPRYVKLELDTPTISKAAATVGAIRHYHDRLLFCISRMWKIWRRAMSRPSSLAESAGLTRRFSRRRR